MNCFACFDIETIPHPDLPPDCIPTFDESAVSLGNLKDPLKIDAKIAEARARFEASLSRTMATDPDLCMVVAFCGCIVDGSSRLYTSPEIPRDEGDEFILLSEALGWLRNCLRDGLPIVTFNGASFDLPVLFRRSLYEDVAIAPSVLEKLTQPPARNRHHIDLMQALAVRSPFSGKPEVKSLSYYLHRLGLSGKTPGMDGSLVYPLWQERRFEEITAYCRDDVDRTADLFQRVSPWLSLPAREFFNSPAAAAGLSGHPVSGDTPPPAQQKGFSNVA
ncbi:MAG: ribonuclease H-like domain-containing protein [Syntrophobacteraceae bacterium]